MNKSSEYSGFYKLTPEERLKIVSEFANLTDEDIRYIAQKVKKIIG